MGVDSFSGIMWIVALLSWTAIDIFLISPLLYLIFVPKPVRKHIKDIHHLTPYEERVREQQLQENPRLDKLMKKYKNMSRISADDEEEGDTPLKRYSCSLRRSVKGKQASFFISAASL